VLRECQLRLWHECKFQEAVNLNRDNFGAKLLKFLEPMTELFRIVFCPLSIAQLGEVIDDMIKVWSYLQSLRGKLVMIHPSREDEFDRIVHDAIDENWSLIEPREASGKRVLFVMRRGIRWYSDVDADGKPDLIIKAKVLLY
jgi:hypothetical protein